MPTPTTPNAYGALSEQATLTFQRILPGPIERVWSYLTDSDLRKMWLAAGAMKLQAGTSFEFVWRNEELATKLGKRPEGQPEEHRMVCEVLEVDPPRKLVISWGRSDGVTFELAPVGEPGREKVLMTVIHKRLPDRDALLSVSAGWHVHLDVLASHLEGETGEPFWQGYTRLKTEYAVRLPG